MEGKVMTLALLIGMILTVVLIIKRKEISTNYWGAGALLFIANALLFALALFMTFFIMLFDMTLVLIVCIPLSIYVWYLFSKNWQGSYKDKIKMAVIGSSFFVAFIGWVIWKYTTFEPAYPGDGLLMSWIGVPIALTGSVSALLVSLFVILKNN
jgi:hypothetical protein